MRIKIKGTNECGTVISTRLVRSPRDRYQQVKIYDVMLDNGNILPFDVTEITKPVTKLTK